MECMTMVEFNWLVEEILVEFWYICTRDTVGNLLWILEDCRVWCQRDSKWLILVVDRNQSNVEAGCKLVP